MPRKPPHRRRAWIKARKSTTRVHKQSYMGLSHYCVRIWSCGDSGGVCGECLSRCWLDGSGPGVLEKGFHEAKLGLAAQDLSDGSNMWHQHRPVRGSEPSERSDGTDGAT